MSRIPYGLKMIGLVVAAFVLSTVWIFLAKSSAPPAVTALPRQVPTATAAPVVQAPPPTQVPTAVPTQPAPTLAPPTATAQPAPPKPSGPSPELQAYGKWAGPEIEIASRSMKGLADQSSAAGQNPRLLTDNTWRLKTGVALAFMKTSGEDLQKYPGTVTPELRRLDQIMKGLGGDLVYVADEFAAGLDQGNVTRINNATARMNAATQKMKDGTAEIQRLNEGGG